MSARALPSLAASILALAACTPTPTAPAPPTPAVTLEAPPPSAAPTAATTTSAAPIVPSATAAATAAAPAPTGLAPYPGAWITEAASENHPLSCTELVYWQGCRQTRTGTVTVEITLAPDGKVKRVTQVENTVKHQPEVIWRCLQKKLPQWKLRAPVEVSPTFRHTLRFGDKC